MSLFQRMAKDLDDVKAQSERERIKVVIKAMTEPELRIDGVRKVSRDPRGRSVIACNVVAFGHRLRHKSESVARTAPTPGAAAAPSAAAAVATAAAIAASGPIAADAHRI